MGTSDKTIRILTVAVFTSIAAYVGYRAYKKRYPFESSITKSAPLNETCDSEKHTPTMISDGDGDESQLQINLQESSLALADEFRSQGNKSFKDGNIDQAIKHYFDAIKYYPVNHPDLALAYANRAACYLKLGRFDAVIDDCSKALNIQPEFVKALDRRSKAFEFLGRLEDSIVDITAACIIDDFQTGYLVERVESILRTLSTENAQKDFESKEFIIPSYALIEEFFSTFPTEWDAIDECPLNKDLEMAINLIKSKKFVEAMNLSEQAIKSEHFRAKSLALHGIVQFLKGDMKSALNTLSSSLQIDPSDSNVLIKLALVELEQNNYIKMTDYLEKAREADPKNPALFYHRGEILALSGNLNESIKDFAIAIDISPNFVLAYVHKARALLGLDRISEAELLLNKALDMFKENVEVRNSLGEVLVMKKEFDAAEKVFDSILKKHPNSPQVYLNKALLAMTRNNDIRAAEANLRCAIEIEPSFEAAHLQLANLLLSNGNVKDSMAHFEQAVKYARTLQELISVHSLKCASVAQLKIAEKFPSLAEKMKALNQIDN